MLKFGPVVDMANRTGMAVAVLLCFGKWRTVSDKATTVEPKNPTIGSHEARRWLLYIFKIRRKKFTLAGAFPKESCGKLRCSRFFERKLDVHIESRSFIRSRTWQSVNQGRNFSNLCTSSSSGRHTSGFRTSRRQFPFRNTLACHKGGRNWTFPQTASGGSIQLPGSVPWGRIKFGQ